MHQVIVEAYGMFNCGIGTQLQHVESSFLHACMCMLRRFSHVRLFKTLWTVARQTPLSMGFSRQEYWSGLPCPSLGDLPDPWILNTHLWSLAFQVGSLPLAPPGKPPSSLTRDQTWAPCIGSILLTAGPPGKSLGELFKRCSPTLNGGQDECLEGLSENQARFHRWPTSWFG